MKLDTKETELFTSLVQLELAKTPEMKSKYLERIALLQDHTTVRDLSVDLFKSIADWYHLAILELSFVSDFEITPAHVARELGISAAEAESAIERLVRIEMLEPNSKGLLQKTKNRILASSSVPNGALRKYHEQMLAKASKSLSEQTPQEKFIGSETFAFDEKQLKEVEDAFESCFAQVIKIASRGKSKKSVYHCGIQFFRLNKKDKSR